MRLKVPPRIKQCGRGAEISAEAFNALQPEVQPFREVLARIESSFEVVQNRLSLLERQQARLEGQLDILMRMQQSAARPPVDPTTYANPSVFSEPANLLWLLP